MPDVGLTPDVRGMDTGVFFPLKNPLPWDSLKCGRKRTVCVCLRGLRLNTSNAEGKTLHFSQIFY